MGRKKKETRITTTGTTDIDKVDVLGANKMVDGGNDSVPEAAESAHSQAGALMLKALREVDEKAREKGIESDLVEQWKMITSFRDVNELVRMNVHQVQVIMQDQMSYYLNHKNRIEKEMEDLLNQAMEHPETLEMFMSQREKLNNERNNLLTGIANTSRTIAALSKEYRQCALGRKFFVHIAAVEQFSIIVKGLIQKYLQDPVVLMKVSNELREAVKDCFPANGQEE